MRLYTLIYLISLLLLLPQAMLGQTYSKYESKGWWNLIVHGGTIRTKTDEGKRTGDYYLKKESGDGLIRMDYVNGFSIGPDMTLGKMLSNHGRLELDLDVEYANARKTWMYDLGLRYILAPRWQSWVEVFAADRTYDFDPDPLMDKAQRQVATGLFGWNRYKLYGARRMGVMGSTLLHDDVVLEGAAWYERREEMRNHRKRNVFRQKGESNGIVHFDSYDLWRTDLSLVIKPGSRLYVFDDMHSVWKTKAPTVRVDTRWGWKEKLHYASVDLNVRQHIGGEKDKHQFDYFASAGWFPVRDEVMLPDMRHFDASHFCWQNQMESSLTWFSLLTNYELSTPKHWAEVHGEYLRRYNSFFAQYLQGHLLSTADHRMHYEASYGWNISKEIRIGLSAGWDGSHFDGLGFNLIITNNN